MNEKVENQTPNETTTLSRHDRVVRHMASYILIIFLVFALAWFSFAWRLSKGPMNANFALPVVEKILGRGDVVKFDIGDLVLAWDSEDRRIALKLRDMTVIGSHGPFLTLDQAELGFSFARLFLLNFPDASISGLALRIIRTQNGTISITGDGDEDEDENLEPAPITLTKIINELPSIGQLNLLDTTVIFEDRQNNTTRWFEKVSAHINQSNDFAGKSLHGSVDMDIAGGDHDGAHIVVDFAYEAGAETLTAIGRIAQGDTKKLMAPWISETELPTLDMVVEAEAELRLRDDFSLKGLAFRVKGKDGLLAWPAKYADIESQKISALDVILDFDADTNKLHLKKAELTSKNVSINVTADLQTKDNLTHIEGPIQISIPRMAVDWVPTLWSKQWDLGAREWLVDHMQNGQFKNIAVNIPIKAMRTESDWSVDPGTTKGTFAFDGVTVDYRNPMAPSTETKGTGIFEGLSLTIDIESSKIADLAVNKARLYFDDIITTGKGDAELKFDITGPVSSVFDYLTKEPISLSDKIDFDISKAEGDAALDVTITFPILKSLKVDDVHVAVDAILNDLKIPSIVQGLDLTGGPYDLKASENHFIISGNGTIGGQPATLLWHELFSPKQGDEFSSKLEADITSNSFIRRKFLGDLEDRIDGIIPAKLSLITTPSGKGTLKAALILDNARIDFMNPFNAVKEKGRNTSATLIATLQNNKIQAIDTLKIDGDGINLSSGLITFARNQKDEPILSKVNFKNLILGATNADINASWRNENNIKATVTGKAFDARWIMGDKEDDSDENLNFDVQLNVDRLQISNGNALEKVDASFVGSSKGVIQIANIDAQADGDLSLRYSASGGPGDRLYWNADNAGRALSSLGITERVRGGKLRVEGTPIKGGQPGDMEGTLIIEDFAVRQAPVLAKLINILSIPGLLKSLEQDTGLKFSRAEADIHWLNRPGGALLQFKDGRTSGASLGLTFEGEINTASDQMAIQGTVIPMSEFNSIMSSIPLVGDILTGGKSGSGIFAATYTMKGPSEDPSVSVNPLSVLTPGILRRILFEGGTPKARTAKPLAEQPKKEE